MPLQAPAIDEQRVHAKAKELLGDLHAKRLQSFQFLSAPAQVYYLARNFIVEGFSIPTIMILVALANNLFTMWAIRQPKLRHVAAPQFVGGLYLLILLMSLCDGMLQSHILWLVTVGPAISCLTMGERAIKAVFVAGLVLIFIPSMAELWWPDLLLRERTPPMILVLRMLCLFLLSGASWLACRHTEHQDRWLKQQNSDHEAARAAAAAAASSKSDFLATMSHEIRTPMNGILGTAQHLARSDLSEQEKGFAGIILDSGRKLLDVVNAILDLSKIESGRFQLRNAPMRLDHCLRDIVREVSRSFSAQKLSILAQNSERPVAMQGDPSRIEQVLRNLLVSFVGYAKTHTIEVQLCAQQGNARFEFRIPELHLDDDAQTTLQEPAKVLTDPEHHHRRVALAMKVSHDIIQLMGGSLRVTSTKEAGTFVIWSLFDASLQLGADPTMTMSHTLENSLLDVGSLSVLVVDDNLINLRVASRQLEQMGCTVTIASDGQQAVQACEQETFSVVFMDLQMPKLSGFEATRIIRSGQGPNAKTPIIAFTADAYDVDLQALSAADMQGHLAKPFRATELRRLLDSLDPNKRGKFAAFERLSA